MGQKAGKPAPVQGLAYKKIIYVDCGDFHSVALTDKGELYSWGGGIYHNNTYDIVISYKRWKLF